MTSPSMRDHVRPTDADYPDGIYRVVGTSGDTVTLLRVGDSDGRRINTGEVVQVSEAAFTAFEPAENPDGNRPLGAAATSTLEMGYWKLRAFGQQLVAHPLETIVGITLVAVGYAGEAIAPLPDAVASVLLFVGALALAYIGSGYLQ